MKKLPALAAVLGVLFGLAVLAQRTLYEVPVLMYHRVEVPVQKDGNFVRPETFERQMEFLKLHRYRVMPLAQLLDDLKNGRPVGPKTVAITFDDGTLDNFRNAFPTLRKMGFPAAIFMITENIGRPGWLSEEDLRILDEGGIAIGSHTVHHAFLPERTEAEAVRELRESKQRLESLLGHPVTLFSYPAGGVTPEIQRWVREAGYAGAVTTNYDTGRHNPYGLHRIKVGESAGNLFNFWIKTSGFYHLGKRRVTARPDARVSGYPQG